MKTIQCRTHGGTFQIVPRRGRPPVKCADDNQCSRHPAVKVIHEGTVRRTSKAVRRNNIRNTPLAVEKAGTNAAAKAAMEERTIRAAVKRAAARQESPNGAPESPVATQTESNVSLPLAMATKAQLEALGWTCTGKAYGAQGVEMHASRGTERMVVIWDGGEVIRQDYSLWDTEKPSANGKPANRTKLPFDTDELTDSELVRALAGMKVIWWNRIAQGEESAVIPSKVQIVHTYNGIGDESPADRVVTFVDMNGTGFRSFRVGALMRIGK